MSLKHPKMSTGTADLSSASLTLDLTAGKYPLQIDGVYLKASVNITETVTVSDRGSDTNYTNTLDTTGLSASQNYVFRPTGTLIIMPGETCRLTCTNANTTGTVYARIKYHEYL